MSVIYVARSASLGKWASDVGLSRHVYKIGIAPGDKSSIETGWAGFADWKLVKTMTCADDLVETEIFERVAAKTKTVDPKLYPRIRGVPGIFKILPAQVENHLTLTRALAGAPLDSDAAPKPAEFADYLVHVATKGGGALSEHVLKDVE